MKRLIWIVISLMLIAFAGFSFYNMQFMPVNSDKTLKTVIVAKGQPASDLADKLKEQNLIRSPFFFKLFLKQNNLEDKIKSGTFKISPSMSSEEISRVLTTVPEDIWVTLLEGWRIEQMGDKLSEELGIKSEEFVKKAKEGYMFPDTYLFPKEVTVDSIVKKLRDTFDLKYSDDLKNKIHAQGLTDSQGVILASIVEREARSDDVRKMVASILLKRFKIGMGLNADATVRYAMDSEILKSGKRPAKFWEAISQKNYNSVISPYNTYLHVGLPPASICNPSLSSLKAVANADLSTPYLYYYHDSKGNSYYGKTLEEHNQNVANYR